jgi:hypothetical protein
LTLNAGRWASVAKDNVIKLSSTAAHQATELTKNVNEKVKEGSLLDSLSYGVTNVSSKMGNAWSNLTSSYWTGTDQLPSIKNSTSSSGLFGRSGYNSVPGDSNSFNANNSNNNNNNNGNNYNSNSLFSDDSNDSMKRTPPKYNSSISQNTNGKNTNDDWNWDESSWDTVNKNTNQTSKAKASNTKPSPPKAKDLMNFDDDNWETIEPSKSK